jgi:signal transduction histidine kinase
MPFPRVGTRSIAFIWCLTFLLLGSALFMGYRRSVASLDQLMRSEAQTLMDVIAVSSAASINALDEVEYLNAERLLDNAWFISRSTGKGVPSVETLRDIASANTLHRVSILDPNGRTLVEAGPGEGETTVYPESYRRAVARVILGEDDAVVMGFMEGRYYKGKQYGVAVARPDGGAVVVDIDPARMLEFRKSVGLGTILRDIGSREGIRYIVLQDTLGIVAASRGIREMTRIADDPFLMKALRGEPGSRIVPFGRENVLEVARPLIGDDSRLGILRIGLSTATVDGIRHRAFRQFLFLLIAAGLSGAFLIVYAVLRQNYTLLNAEHDRILGEVRLMEEERRRSERLTSMGRLAAGVAHEIRNPLNAVSIIAQRLKAEFAPAAEEDREEYRALLTTVRSEIARIGGIIEDFLRFARPPKLEIVPVNPGELVSHVLRVVGEKARLHRIALSSDVPDGIELRCDIDQMKQALLNITLNALDAAGENGAVSITVRREDHGARIEIADSGPGIPEQVMPNIFDPYFTTKESGTGLGLGEVHRIITAHGGRVTAANIPSGGAVFTVYLPGPSEKG